MAMVNLAQSYHLLGNRRRERFWLKKAMNEGSHDATLRAAVRFLGLPGDREEAWVRRQLRQRTLDGPNKAEARRLLRLLDKNVR
jgi:hypothetical protein